MGLIELGSPALEAKDKPKAGNSKEQWGPLLKLLKGVEKKQGKILYPAV